MDNYPETETGAGGDFLNPGFPSVFVGKSQNAGLTWTHTLSPNMVNEAKASFLRSKADFPCTDCSVPSIGTIDNLGLGFGSSSALPQFFTENTFQWLDNSPGATEGIPSKWVANTGGRATAPLSRPTPMVYTRSGIRKDLLTDGAILDSIGYGGFYASEASVNPSSPTPAYPEYYRGYRGNEFGFYGEDAIKASSRVTVTVGLRWDYFGVPHNFRPNIDSNLYDGSGSFNQCRNNAHGVLKCFPGDTSPPPGW